MTVRPILFLTQGARSWPLAGITKVVDIENLTEALKSGPYGRCVYDCDNDVNDNQVLTYLLTYERCLHT